MAEFILIFRRDYKSADIQPTQEKFSEHLKHWDAWYGSLNEAGVLVRPNQRIDGVGKIVKADAVIDGPYSEIKESVGGFIIVKANDYDEAEEIAEGCPVLELGGNVEIRQGL
jgi:hypothetical protein